MKAGVLQFVAFGLAVAAPVSDGERWAAIQRSAEAIEIRDDRRGKRWTLALGCRPVSIGRSGLLLTACADDSNVVVDLRTGAQERFVTPVLADFAVQYATDVGRHWIREYVDGYHWWGVHYRHRTTGEVRGVDARRSYADLDAPELARPLCTPLARFSNDNGLEDGPRYAEFAYDGRAGAYGQRLWRCGDKRPRVLRHSRGLRVGGGWATWTAGTSVFALRLRDGRRFEWPRRSGELAHTRRALYLREGRRVLRARL